MGKSIVTIDTDSCKGCELCIHICPRQVLALDRNRFNARGVYPASVVNLSECICCASCALMCPDGAITIEKEMD